MVYDFGDFELDTRLCELRREAERHHLEPQVYDVLEYLVTHRDRLVTRDELLDQVWGHRFVTPSALSTRIKTARRAVGDDGRAQRIIRTVRGRGFRFLAEVEARPGSEAAGPPAHGSEPLAVPSPSEDASASPTPRARALVRKPSRPPPLVGRGAELEALGGRWSEATGGRRGIVLVAGESGIGKTAIAEAFAWSVRDEGGRVARGQCLEQRGAGEPYLPFLDALSRLCRAPGGSEVSRLLSTHAPTWLAQIPSVSVPSDVEATAVA